MLTLSFAVIGLKNNQYSTGESKKEYLIENTAYLLARISFRQIRCFIAVAQNGSFMAAANVLGITQPAVSRSIREIESILSVSLFDRSLRGAVLTPHGRKLFDAAEAGIALMTEGVRATQDISGSRELLRIGALPNVCGVILPTIIEDFQHAYPHTTIRIVSGANADLLARLRQGGLDLVIGRLSDTVSMKGLTFQHLYDEEIVFAIGAQHVLAKPGASVELRTVLEMPMLAPIPGTVIRQELERFLFRSGVVAPDFALESIDAGFINKIIRASNHVVVTVEALVTEARTSGDVVVLPIHDDALRGPVGLTMLPDTQPGPALRLLMQMFREKLPGDSKYTKNDMKTMEKE